MVWTKVTVSSCMYYYTVNLSSSVIIRDAVIVKWAVMQQTKPITFTYTSPDLFFFCLFLKSSFQLITGITRSVIVAHCRSLQIIVGHCRSLQIIVGHCRSLQIIVGHCRLLQIIVGHCRSLQVIVGHCRSFIVGHCRSLQIIVGHCRSLQVTVDHCRSLQVIPCFSNYDFDPKFKTFSRLHQIGDQQRPLKNAGTKLFP